MDCEDIPTIQKRVLLDKPFAPGRFSKQAIEKYFMTQIHFIKILNNILIEFPLLPVFLGIWLLKSLSKVLVTCKLYNADVSSNFSVVVTLIHIRIVHYTKRWSGIVKNDDISCKREGEETKKLAEEAQECKVWFRC